MFFKATAFLLKWFASHSRLFPQHESAQGFSPSFGVAPPPFLPTFSHLLAPDSTLTVGSAWRLPLSTVLFGKLCVCVSLGGSNYQETERLFRTGLRFQTLMVKAPWGWDATENKGREQGPEAEESMGPL